MEWRDVAYCAFSGLSYRLNRVSKYEGKLDTKIIVG